MYGVVTISRARTQRDRQTETYCVLQCLVVGIHYQYTYLSSADVFQCLGTRLMWMGKQMQTKYCLSPTGVLEETPWVIAIHLGKNHHRRSDPFDMGLHEVRVAARNRSFLEAALCTRSAAAC